MILQSFTVCVSVLPCSLFFSSFTHDRGNRAGDVCVCRRSCVCSHNQRGTNEWPGHRVIPPPPQKKLSYSGPMIKCSRPGPSVLFLSKLSSGNTSGPKRKQATLQCFANLPLLLLLPPSPRRQNLDISPFVCFTSRRALPSIPVPKKNYILSFFNVLGSFSLPCPGLSCPVLAYPILSCPDPTSTTTTTPSGPTLSCDSYTPRGTYVDAYIHRYIQGY